MRGLAANARAMASCSCTRHHPAQTVEKIRSKIGKKVECELWKFAFAVPPRETTHQNVLTHCEARDDAASLWHITDAIAGSLVRRCMGDLVAIEENPPGDAVG